MDSERDEALLLTHPYPFFDEGYAEDNIVGAVERFDGHTYLISPGGFDEPHGGRDSYDTVLEDQDGGGWLREKHVRQLEATHDRLLVGGGYLGACLSSTLSSLQDGTGDEPGPAIDLLVETVYGRQGGACYTLDEMVNGLVEEEPSTAYPRDGPADTLEAAHVHGLDWERLGLETFRPDDETVTRQVEDYLEHMQRAEQGWRELQENYVPLTDDWLVDGEPVDGHVSLLSFAGEDVETFSFSQTYSGTEATYHLSDSSFCIEG